MRAGAALLLASSLGCGEDGPAQREFENTGAVCLEPTEDGVTLRVVVAHQDSRSPCEEYEGSCTVRRERERLVIESRGVLTSTDAEVCPTEAVPVRTVCEVGLPEPGRYRVEHGRFNDDVQFPLATRTALFTEPGMSDFCTNRPEEERVRYE